MCFPSVSAQGYWCSRWNVQFLPISACFSHLGSLASLQSTDAKLLCAKWQFSTQTADAGFFCNGTHTERVGDSKHTLDNLSPCFGQFSVQQTVQVLSIATACRSLPAVCCASVLEGTDSTDEVQAVSQAIKEDGGSAGKCRNETETESTVWLCIFLMYHLGWFYL